MRNNAVQFIENFGAVEDWKDMTMGDFIKSDISELKKKEYGNFSDLDSAKCLIDTLDKNAEFSRRAAAKYLHSILP